MIKLKLINFFLSANKKKTASANTKNSPYARNGGCPLCDSSVYSYCYQKVYHDSCCCNGPNRHQIFDFGVGSMIFFEIFFFEMKINSNFLGQFGGGHGGGGGYGCDCRFLHANSCREHQLIASCCCDEPFRK